MISCLTLKKRLAACLAVAAVFCFSRSSAQQIDYYKEPTWKPRAVLPYQDAINNDFWPASPKVDADRNDAGFDMSRLSQVPAPGIYPRVLLTPTDIDAIRNKVAMGDKAPAPFKTMWERNLANKGAFYALVTKDDALGKSLAEGLVAKAKALGPKIDALDKQADRDVLWSAERSVVASGNPDPPARSTTYWTMTTCTIGSAKQIGRSSNRS